MLCIKVTTLASKLNRSLVRLEPDAWKARKSGSQGGPDVWVLPDESVVAQFAAPLSSFHFLFPLISRSIFIFPSQPIHLFALLVRHLYDHQQVYHASLLLAYQYAFVVRLTNQIGNRS